MMERLDFESGRIEGGGGGGSGRGGGRWQVNGSGFAVGAGGRRSGPRGRRRMAGAWSTPEEEMVGGGRGGFISDAAADAADAA